MNGSGSAPITMAPGCPHAVQQTILAFGVLRGMTVMPGVGFAYPCPAYVRCYLFAFRASAEDEEAEMPRAQTSNPSTTDVLLLLAMTMEFLHRFLSAPGNSGACCRRSQPILARKGWLRGERSNGRPAIRFTWFPVRVADLAISYRDGKDHVGLQAGATAWLASDRNS